MLKRFGRDAVVYTIPLALSRSVGWITLPVFTRLLTPEEFGATTIVTAFFLFVYPVVSLETRQGVARALAEETTPLARGAIISGALWFHIVGFGLVAAAMWLRPETTSAVIFGTRRYAHAVPTIGAYMMGAALVTVAMTALRWTRQPGGAAISALGPLLGTLAVGVPLVLDGRGFDGWLTGRLSGAALGTAVAVWALSRGVPLLTSGGLTRLSGIIRYSYPLVFSSVGLYLAINLDRWSISRLMGLEAVGPYAAALTLASVFKVVEIGFQSAVSPIIFEQRNAPTTPAFVARVFDWYVLLAVALTAAMTAANPFLFAKLDWPTSHRIGR